jgi:Domain of unknown function (DUF4335)
MESTNLPRTYTAQTCNLVVTDRGGLGPQAKLDRVNRSNTGEFTLKIDRSEHSNADPIVLNGQLDQLDKLQQTVSEYVGQLETEAPTIAIEDRQPVRFQPEDRFVEPTDSAIANRLYPESGIVKNLPGLRPRTSQVTIETVPSQEPHSFSAASISKLFNRSKENSTLIAPDSPIAPPSPPTPTFGSTKLPRVTVGDRPLEYKLYLSDNNSGRVLTLTQMQLVDLATTLDKYINDTVTASSLATQTVEFIEIPAAHTPAIKPAKIETPVAHTPEIKPAKIETPVAYTPEIKPAKIETVKIEEDVKLPSVVTVSALSRLPNLPSIPSKINSNRSYDYDDDSQPAFMSALPWLAAAAVAVGVPLFVFNANPNLLKESMAKVKMPIDPQQLLEGKKEDAPVNPLQPGTNPNGGDVANATTANLPKAWESQPVVPPTNPASVASPIPQPPGANGISIAPLPPSIANIPEQVASPQELPTASSGDSGAAMASVPPQQPKTASGIAPNPLGVGAIPQGLDNPKEQQQLPVTTATANIPVSPIVTQPKAIKPATTVASKSKATKPATTVASKSKGIISIVGSIDSKAYPADNRISKATKIKSVSPKQNNQLSVSSQPMLLPPDLGAMGNEPPLTPPPFPAAKVVKPAPIAPVKQYKKVVKAKAKPIVIAKKSVVTPIATTVAKKVMTPTATTVARKAVRVIPIQTPEPITVPEFTNPSIESTTPQVVAPIVTEPQLQSNNNRTPDLLDNPSLNETKRYFQSKWRADLNQSSPLQYVVQFNPKSGVVQSVDPQGEASTTYLKKTGVIKTGQKLVSPITSGEGEQKIRVLLQPDGNVETFIEP